MGYASIAIAALVASGGLIVPVPALTAVCTASSFLDPPLIGVIAGASEAVGELTGYFLGQCQSFKRLTAMMYQATSGSGLTC